MNESHLGSIILTTTYTYIIQYNVKPLLRTAPRHR